MGLRHRLLVPEIDSEMAKIDWREIQDVLRRQGIRIGRGLSTREFTRIEKLHGFQFPPDLRDFLACGLPRGKEWPKWRRPASNDVAFRLAWPTDGVLYDVRSGFWLSDWGKRPGTKDEACAFAEAACRDAPKLIPIYGHRYMPAEPCTPGNPVLSTYQTDIIYYGSDLRDYLQAEFVESRTVHDTSACRQVPLWSRIMDYEDDEDWQAWDEGNSGVECDA
jgi:hypothetical protein